MASFSGIVSCIRTMPNQVDNVYSAVGDKAVNFRSGTVLSLNDRVEFDIDPNGSASAPPMAQNVSVIGKADKQGIDAAVIALSESVDLRDNFSAVDELLAKHREILACAKNMEGALVDCARALTMAFISGAPITVRFHNDGDGSTGAMALYLALGKLQERISFGGRNITWKMHRGISYDEQSSFEDLMHFSQYESSGRPIVVIIDFGTSPESEKSINQVKDKEKAQLVWLDHHPPYEGFPQDMIGFYINPWNFGGNSDFTAGALACVFATVINRCDAAALVEASLVSDYSAYADYDDKQAQETALVLDLLTSGSRSHSMASPTPKTFLDVLGNKKLYSDTMFHARNLLDEALEIALQRAKRYKNTFGIGIYVLDFGYIAELGNGYPLPGRFSSRLQGKLEGINGGKTLTIVHYGNYISIRESDDIVPKIKVLDLVNELKASSEYVESGGGHNEAASMRVPRQHTKQVLKLLLSNLGANPD